LRIHVHGTRGKSTVTRILASLLREAGHVVLSKTTGDRPEYEFPDASTRPVRRVGPARIQEHVKILRLAARLKATAVVVEGMALQDETLAVSEKMLQATHAVITNVRPDHSETMGQGRANVARALSFMLPPGRPVFTAREDGVEEVCRHARNLNCDCHVVESEMVGSGTPRQENGNAPMLEQPLQLALAVAEHLHGQVPVIENQRSSARCGLCHDTAPSPVSLLDIAGVRVIWLDLFSVNDVDSSRLLLDALWNNLPTPAWFVAILATRQDRPMRTAVFMDWLQHEPRFDLLAPTGSHAWAAWCRSPARSLFLPNPLCEPYALLHKLAQERQKGGRQAAHPMVLVGLGNSHGYGERWRAMISQARETSHVS
jgi:poly-gamma-glutamate synthase PgsB/CapB